MLEEIPLKIPDKVMTNNKTSVINAVIDFFVTITKSKANKVRTIANIITLTVTSKNNVNSKKFFRVESRKMSKRTAFTIENIKVESNDRTIELAINPVRRTFQLGINNWL